jgi:ACS family hexuronate transporter-like MFS transporter
VALFDSGSSIGAAVAPWLVLMLMGHLGGWRWVFILVGTLGFLWLALWLGSYHPPETHPRVSPEERAMILATARTSARPRRPPRPRKPVRRSRASDAAVAAADRGARSRRARSPIPSGS